MVPRTRWVLVALAWVAVAAALGVWLGAPWQMALRDQLRHWQFWALELQFVALVALTCVVTPSLLRLLNLRTGDLAIPAAISILALALTTLMAPRTNRIYYDEQIYQSIGQNLADLHLAQMCNDGNVEYGTLQCLRGEYNKQPYGYPYLLSVAYRIAGVRESVAFAVDPIAAALTIWVVFLLVRLLTDRSDAAMYAALVAALMPEQLRWSHTTAAEPAAACACALAVLAALAFVRLRSTASLVWAAAASAFALQFRPECALVVPVAAVIVLLEAPDEFLRPRLWLVAALGLALAGVHVGHLMAVRNEGWGASGDRLSLNFVRGNLRVNGWFYLGDPRFPVAYTALALASLLAWKPRRPVVVPSLCFVLFWGIFLFFYAGSYDYGADDRYSLMTYPPVAVLAGIGAAAIADQVSRWRPSVTVAPIRVAAAVVAALVVQFLWYAPFVRSIGEEAWGARADVRFARQMTRELPPNAIVLTHNPNMFHVWGQSAAQLSLAASSAQYVERTLATRYAGGVYLHWSFWCNVNDAQQRAYCNTALERYPHTLVREYRERDYRYALYRLAPAPPANDISVEGRTQ